MGTVRTQRYRLATEAILLSLLLAQPAQTVVAAARGRADGNSAADREQQVQRFVDELEARLSISQKIVVVVVPKNALIVSVQPPNERDDAFQLSIENGFLDGLSEEDLRAIVAHELGHVWIFTHHPYLQTEELANQIALRLVSRDELTAMYGRLWERTGVQGHLTYVSPDAATREASHDRPRFPN